tara:strand:- start:601 stop:1638 length:1038 start_codon:yes stop_codon:yes gene_type:complete
VNKYFTQEELDNTNFNDFTDLLSKCDKDTLFRTIETFAKSSKSIKLKNSAKTLHAKLYGTKSAFYADENGQYYTKPEIAKMCITNVDLTGFDFIVEPSAGHGDFFNLLPGEKRYGIDIDPKIPEIEEGDFFDYDFANSKGEKIAVVGNPPFGNNSKLAVDFFQHSSKYASKIAFILPRTFRKATLTNRINMNFWLEKEIILPENSFYIEDLGGSKEDYDVPCVFQVWSRRKEKRPKIVEPLTHPDFSFMDRLDANIAIRRVGALAGKVFDTIGPDEKGLRTPSHYFIKTLSESAAEIFKRMWKGEFSPAADPNHMGFKYDTSGNPSISKSELVKTYAKYKKKFKI